jgi:hypothetical protein
MAPRSVRSAYDRGSQATLVGYRMVNQKFIISSSSVLAVVINQQSALGPCEGLWLVLLVGNL